MFTTFLFCRPIGGDYLLLGFVPDSFFRVLMTLS